MCTLNRFWIVSWMQFDVLVLLCNKTINLKWHSWWCRSVTTLDSFREVRMQMGKIRMFHLVLWLIVKLLTQQKWTFIWFPMPASRYACMRKVKIKFIRQLELSNQPADYVTHYVLYRVFLHKLIVARQFKKFSAFMEHEGSSPLLLDSALSLLNTHCVFKIFFNIILHSVPSSLKLSLTIMFCVLNCILTIRSFFLYWHDSVWNVIIVHLMKC